ncbi:hypothetical protein [Spirosoma pulveris]
MHFIFQFGEFSGEEESKFWDYVWQFLAVAVPLYIYYRGNQYIRKKEAKQKADAEKSKLHYLYFLVRDTLSAVDILSENLESLEKNRNVNLLKNPKLQIKPPISMQRIAEKINQEEYYLASVNQIKWEGIADIFILFDYLNHQVNNLITLHNKYAGINDGMRESFAKNVNSFKVEYFFVLNGIGKSDLKQDQKKVLANEMLELYSIFQQKVEEKGSNGHQYISKEVILPLINLLEPYREIQEFKTLIIKAVDIRREQAQIEAHVSYHISGLLKIIQNMQELKVEKEKALQVLQEYVKFHSLNSRNPTFNERPNLYN